MVGDIALHIIKMEWQIRLYLLEKVTWNGADYKVDKESYDKLKEYIDTLYK